MNDPRNIPCGLCLSLIPTRDTPAVDTKISGLGKCSPILTHSLLIPVYNAGEVTQLLNR